MMEESIPSQQEQPVRVLVVDDELCTSYALAQAFRSSGFVADIAASGEEALHKLEHSPYDVMVLDLHMPGMSGENLMPVVHARWPELLVLVLTGYATLDSAITAVKTGVTDYLRKPIGVHEVVAAVERALQKRAERRRREHLVQLIYQALEELQISSDQSPVPTPSLPSEGHIHLPPLVLDRQRRQLFLDLGSGDMVVELSESEARILSVLMSRPGNVFSCRQLVQEALGEQLDAITAENIVRPVISRLRAKLKSFSSSSLPAIRTVRGRGYFLEVLPSQALSSSAT